VNDYFPFPEWEERNKEMSKEGLRTVKIAQDKARKSGYCYACRRIKRTLVSKTRCMACYQKWKYRTDEKHKRKMNEASKKYQKKNRAEIEYRKWVREKLQITEKHGGSTNQKEG